METVVILDFGSQYTQVIARRVREMGVYSKIMPYNTGVEVLRGEVGLKGLIMSGGPASVFGEGAPRPDMGVYELGVPVLGICYGVQLFGVLFGGKVARGDRREYGSGRLWKVGGGGRILEGVGDGTRVWNSHGDKLLELPEGFEGVGRTENADYAVIEDRGRGYYGLQFHPEVMHTEEGGLILENFLKGICGCEATRDMGHVAEEIIERVRGQVGDGGVVLGLSGGVDSSVVAMLLQRAIGERLVCVFVDHGLLRKGEGEEVKELFEGHFKMNLRVVDAKEEFYRALEGVEEPEEKRKIIGRKFVEVFEREVAGMPEVKFLGQGTIYPDVIESVSIDGSPAVTIKSHHNVGGLPERMRLGLVEPIRELFKDEVRVLGRLMGLPGSLLDRHPFPGPGLAVRILGAVTEEAVRVLQDADAIFMEELRGRGYYDKVWQAFCVYLPVRTVGVKGDERSYEHVVGLRAVTSVDGMTADWARLPYELLEVVAGRICNEVHGVNRVVYDVTSKPPATIEWL